jgi:uncharacterized membrane protein YphA (DoxX/SURF4 family)
MKHSLTKHSLIFLRLGLAITFIWIGALIVQSPDSWAGFIQPWATGLLILPVAKAMTVVGFFDIVLGVWLLTNRLVWAAALLASIHLLIILVTSGVNDVTIRDIGLLGAAITLALANWPANLPFVRVKNKD